jgi:hypothetical protein
VNAAVELNSSALFFADMRPEDGDAGMSISPLRICQRRCSESSVQSDRIRSACSRPVIENLRIGIGGWMAVERLNYTGFFARARFRFA